ncbi:hypothetical protein AALA24_03225 [Anaerovoracaceae bacterium 42-11]
MSVCEIVISLIIGIISGGISSFFVSVYLQKRWNEKEKLAEAERMKQKNREDFEKEKQIFHRYIERIRSELLLAYKSCDYDYVFRTIEDEPIRKTFNKLSDNSDIEFKQIGCYIKNLREDLENKKLDEDGYKAKSGMLFKYSVQVLKFQLKEDDDIESYD